MLNIAQILVYDHINRGTQEATVLLFLSGEITTETNG